MARCTSVSLRRWNSLLVVGTGGELYRLERFLRRCTILAMIETIAARAVTLLRQYRLSHGLSITDALIAASALVYSDTLYTKNVRDFQMIPV